MQIKQRYTADSSDKLVEYLMLSESLDPHWIEAFEQVFALCKVKPEETVVILSETHSRDINVLLAELALARLGANYYQLRVPSQKPSVGPVIRSSGASTALNKQNAVVDSLAAADFVVDLTLEGLMHAPQTGRILRGGARILNVSNEHPEALVRMLPKASVKGAVREAVKRCKASRTLSITSSAGSALSVQMQGASTVGVWGWTDRPGTLAHWPGGIVVSFPAAQSVQGRLVFQPGDLNLSFKRYFESEVVFEIRDDFVTDIQGQGLDARLMREYLKSFGDKNAYATSHVGWGLNPGSRYEALCCYDQRETNGTELRALAGNFLYSTGANEFANRFTDGHFDLPMMECTIALDGVNVVEQGELVQ